MSFVEYMNAYMNVYKSHQLIRNLFVSTFYPKKLINLGKQLQEHDSRL